MLSITDTLRELHRLRKLIRELQEQIDEGPRLLTSQQNRLERAESDLRHAQDELKHLKVSVNDKEKTLKATHQQVAKYEKQRETASSKKELDAFEAEIRHAQEKCSQLEDEILNGLGEIDDRTAKLPEIEKELARVREEAAGFQKESQERHDRLTRELGRAGSELAEIEKAMPEDIRAPYQRLIHSYGADAMAQVREGTCTHCYGAVTKQTQRELEGGGRFVTCQSCGRALYL